MKSSTFETGLSVNGFSARALIEETNDINSNQNKSNMFFCGRGEKMISVQVPPSLCMQNKLIIHSRYCFVERNIHFTVSRRIRKQTERTISR